MKIIAALVVCIFVSSCATQNETRQVGAVTNVVGAADKFIIISGKGLDACHIGGSEDCFKILFGGNKDKDYWISEEHGVSAYVENGKISNMSFAFRSGGYRPSSAFAPFNGTTDRNIGISSSIQDVIAAYGKPSRQGESVVSQYGVRPGAVEASLHYEQLGMFFLFQNRELLSISLNGQNK